MTDQQGAAARAAALRSRLRTVATTLGVALPEPLDDDVAEAAQVMSPIVDHVARAQRPEEIWLLHVAMTGSFPGTEAMADAIAAFAVEPATTIAVWVSRAWRPAAIDHRSAITEMRIVHEGVLLDVTNTARLDLHTGIQRVIRSAARSWVDQGVEVVPVAWTGDWQAYRTLDGTERRRVFDWHGHQSAAAEPTDTSSAPVLVVPWLTTLVLAESLDAGSCDRLVAMARHSGSELAAIGYDLIPALSGDLVPMALSEQFMSYLSVIGELHRVVAISESAATEFRGFAQMVTTRGLPGPQVTTCALPSPPTAPNAETARPGRARVLVVGSYEPRKNHAAVLHAAERLWREHLDFELHLVGGSSWVPAIGETVDRLAAEGRPVYRHLAISEQDLAAQYHAATVTVLLSLHEGYGLPVVESLAAGTPALVSDFGSISEIAAGGGCLSVDPRDDAAVIAAMRSLLTDDDLLAGLRRELTAHPAADWSDYARASWALLVP